MLGAIEDTDMTASEFQKHRKCYKEYIQILAKTSNNQEAPGSQCAYEKCDFESVRKLLKQTLLKKTCAYLSILY